MEFFLGKGLLGESFEFVEEFYNKLYKAYKDAKKKKGRTPNAVLFEANCEENLYNLMVDILKREYKILPFNAFIATRPVKREIFAAKFPDRIIHHWIMNEIGEIIDAQFIYDSYACRKNKGTLFGINRLYNGIRKCSQNFTKETYVLKLDVQNFFMSLDRRKVWDVVRNTVIKKYNGKYKETVLYLCETVIMHNPVVDCVRTSDIKMWNNFPKHKSLFYNKPFYGLPIGNLTSQFFANLYLTKFDRWIKEELKVKYYGRYVDDFYILDTDIERLKSFIPKIRNFLKEELSLVLHPKKIYLHNVNEGVEFLGARVYPHKIHLSKRSYGNFINFFNNVEHVNFEKLDANGLKLMETRINSYLGLCSHMNTYQLRKDLLNGFTNDIWKYMYHTNYSKVNVVEKQDMFSFFGWKNENK